MAALRLRRDGELTLVGGGVVSPHGDRRLEESVRGIGHVIWQDIPIVVPVIHSLKFRRGGSKYQKLISITRSPTTTSGCLNLCGYIPGNLWFTFEAKNGGNINDEGL